VKQRRPRASRRRYDKFFPFEEEVLVSLRANSSGEMDLTLSSRDDGGLQMAREFKGRQSLGLESLEEEEGDEELIKGDR